MSSKFTSVFAGWFIDGTGKTALNQVMITFHDGLITEVAEKHLETGPDYHQLHGGVMDLSGFTLVPALVDAHVHLFMSGTEDIMIRQHQLEAGFEEIRPVMEEHLSRYLAHGIIAVRDGGDHLGHAMRYKEQCLDFKTAPIFLKVAGKAWNRKGRYGKLIGRFPQEGKTLAEAIEKDLAELYPRMPDHIKIVNSGINSLKNFGKQTLPQFGPEEMKEAVRAAADHGLPVMVHANGEEPVKIAVEAGCRSIEHGFFSGEDNLRRMADHGTYWVPTACTMKGYAETLPPDSPEAFSARRYLEHQVAQMGLAEKLKVPMAVGTDSGSMGVHHGQSLLEELKLFVKAGFGLEKAISCASKNGADLLGLENTGTLSKSKKMVCIAVKGGPENFLNRFKNSRVISAHNLSGDLPNPGFDLKF